MSELQKSVDIREIDLLVIASDVYNVASDWPEQTHVFCFSADVDELPGPFPHSVLHTPDCAETEEFLLPDIPLPLDRRRETDYGFLTSVRGWPRLNLKFSTDRNRGFLLPEQGRKDATIIFNGGAIICEHQTKIPLAVYFLRESTNLGVAWLPSVHTNQAAWVELIVTQWAQYDKDRFPGIGDWINSTEWIVPEEEQLLSQIEALEQKKQASIIKMGKKIDELPLC